MKKKRFLSLMLSILILVCPVASMLSVQGMDYGCYYIKGDTDGNGVINIRDATTVQRILAEYEVPIDDVIERANVTGGDTLTVNDATEIQKYLAEYDNPYSVGKSIFTDTAESTPLPVAKYTVTFKNSNGGVILTQTVDQGQAPCYPVAPELDGYVFRGWDKVVGAVTEDVVITAIYDKASGTASAPSKISELQNDAGYITGREDYCFSLPPVIYTGLNGETRIYPQNIFTPNYMMYWGQYTNATTIREHGDYVSLVGTSVASKNIKYRTYDKSYRMIESGTTRVVINSEPPESQTMLLLGDSFISQNYIGPDLRALFAADGNTLTLIGTKSTSPKLHEGYAGWKYTDFTNPIKASSNAFWNSSTGKFDFSHYMTANGYSNLNSVYIQLGTNDASASYIQDDFADTTAAAREIVSSILDYDPNIKIYLGLTVMPTLISTNFAAKYNGVGVPWIMRYNMQRLNAAIIAEFSSDSAVKIVATNCILDSSTDIADNVHPNEGGYQKIAQQLYYTMMN